MSARERRVPAGVSERRGESIGMKRRRVLGALMLGTFSPTFGVRSATAQAARPISVGLLSPTASEWPTLVSDELGFFRRYNLDPGFISTGSVAGMAQQIVAGSLDVGEISSTQIVVAVQGGARLRHFCQRASTPPYSFVAQKQYRSYADLRGKLLIIGGPTDITYIFTEKMLAKGGLKMSDVDFTYAGGTAERYAALKSGSVAGAILFPPFDFRAVAEGYNRLGTLSEAMPPFPFDGWAVTDGFAQSHADLLVDFTKGYLRGVRWVNDPANRSRAIEILLKRTNVSADDAAKTYDVLLVKNRVFAPTGIIAPRVFAQVIDALAELKLVSPPLPPPTNFYDNRFVERANAQLAREPK